ncbi:MAG: hypothetical protein HY895_15520 [Deltaproteobacteria bacterium]|nr:hypothetical protein [Deltaproteobacteria bacterium]
MGKQEPHAPRSMRLTARLLSVLIVRSFSHIILAPSEDDISIKNSPGLHGLEKYSVWEESDAKMISKAVSGMPSCWFRMGAIADGSAVPPWSNLPISLANPAGSTIILHSASIWKLSRGSGSDPNKFGNFLPSTSFHVHKVNPVFFLDCSLSPPTAAKQNRYALQAKWAGES